MGGMTKIAVQDARRATRIPAERDVLRRVDLGLATAWEEPQTEAELKLADIWQQVLGIDAVGAADDFFELGGDSFAATALAAEIEATFNVRFAPSAIINFSTIAKQARTVAEEPSSPSRLPSHLIIGRAGGSQPPLFVVHGMAGFAFFNRALIDEMGEDRPIYLFQVPGLDGRTKPLESFEEIAGVYVASIRDIRPGGPYNILAFCGGALLALEMCKQIEEAGETVDHLILLDPLPLPPTIRAIVELHREVEKSRTEAALAPFKSLYKKTLGFLNSRSWTGDGPEQRLRIRAEKLQRLIQRRRAGDIDALPEGKAHPEERSYSPEAMLEASLQLRRALARYVPRPCLGNAALLVCAKQAPKTLGHGSFWRTYLGHIDYQLCDGEHDDIFSAQIVEAGQFVRNVLNSELTKSPHTPRRAQAAIEKSEDNVLVEEFG
jgi:thioesterase domain-containing protein/acyl carrier protein